MSVEKAEEILRLQNKNGNGSWHDYVTRFEILELLESMRDLDGEKDQKPSWYYGKWYKEGRDPEVTCWHCGKTFLCDCMDACCRLCGAPFAKERCEEFKFIPTLVQPIPSGYWFINDVWEMEYKRLDTATELGFLLYQKRKAVGNCFSTEEEAMEKLSKLTGGKDE